MTAAIESESLPVTVERRQRLDRIGGDGVHAQQRRRQGFWARQPSPACRQGSSNHGSARNRSTAGTARRRVVATVVKPSSRECVGLDGCRRVRVLDQPVGHTLPDGGVAAEPNRVTQDRTPADQPERGVPDDGRGQQRRGDAGGGAVGDRGLPGSDRSPRRLDSRRRG